MAEKIIKQTDLTGFGNLSGLEAPNCLISFSPTSSMPIAKAWNKTYNPHGSLLGVRMLIGDIDYFRTMVKKYQFC